MDTSTAIRTRRTVRRYKNRAVAGRLIKKILDAGRWAPSFHNTQPWRFIVIGEKAKMGLVEALKKHKGKEPLIVRMTLNSGISMIKEAPVAVLIYNNRSFSRKLEKHSRYTKGYLEGVAVREIQSVACAIQNMLLEAHALGLGAAWLGIPTFREEYINRLFGTKDSLAAIITLGHPSERPRPPCRMAINEITSFRK
jgi:nitroreductase